MLSFPYLLPLILNWLQPNIIFRDKTTRKVAYLTIDDAPTEATIKILEVLAKHKVTATFFVISDRVRSDQDLKAITAAGHRLGHHMRTTKACSTLDWATFVADFDSTDTLLKRAGSSVFFRPPSDFGTSEQLNYAKSKGYLPILGTVFPLDHWLRHKRLLVLLDEWLTVPGSIVIMHDGIERGPTTAAVLDRLIPLLREEGYEFGDLNSLTVPSSNL